MKQSMSLAPQDHNSISGWCWSTILDGLDMTSSKFDLFPLVFQRCVCKSFSDTPLDLSGLPVLQEVYPNLISCKASGLCRPAISSIFQPASSLPPLSRQEPPRHFIHLSTGIIATSLIPILSLAQSLQPTAVILFVFQAPPVCGRHFTHLSSGNIAITLIPILSRSAPWLRGHHSIHYFI